MSELKERLLTEAMQLPQADRQDLAERLIISIADVGEAGLESIEPELLEFWRQEIRLRMEAYERGETEAIDADVVFERLRRKYGP